MLSHYNGCLFKIVRLIFGDGLINSVHHLLCHSLQRTNLYSANPISMTGGIGQKKFQKVMQTYSKFCSRKQFLTRLWKTGENLDKKFWKPKNLC